jgi:hypothetical protein
LADYGKDYYYIQLEDYQNPPPSSGGGPGGSVAPSGAPQNGTSQIGDPTGSNTSASGAASNGPPGVGPNDFAVQRPGSQGTILPTPVSASGGFDNGNSYGPSFRNNDAPLYADRDNDRRRQVIPINTQNAGPSDGSGGPPPTGTQSAGGPGEGSGAGSSQGNPAGGAGGGPPPGGPGGPGGGPLIGYGILTYKTSSSYIPDSVFQTPPNNLTDLIPIVLLSKLKYSNGFSFPTQPLDPLIKT